MRAVPVDPIHPKARLMVSSGPRSARYRIEIDRIRGGSFRSAGGQNQCDFRSVLFGEYYRNPEATGKSRINGEFHTGDLDTFAKAICLSSARG